MNDKAVFLDRDGVIIEDVDHISNPEQVRLIKNSAKAISMLNKKYLVIIVSNQAAVGRGICTEKDAQDIDRTMLIELYKENAMINAIYSCYHHPEHGIGKYKQNCMCRKPRTGMILQAQNEFHIGHGGYLIGDKTSDIKAGNLAGLETILVKTGYAGNDGLCPDAIPNHVAENLYSAAKIILGETE